MFINIRILLCFGTSYGMMLVALLLVFYLIFGNIQRGSTKYSIRKVKRQREHIIKRKTASALSRKNKSLFWGEVKKVKCPSFTLC